MSDPANGRTHEPSFRELVAELDGLRQIIAANDRLYTERDESQKESVRTALAAMNKQTEQSFQASEKAIVKAEAAQESYNKSHNDRMPRDEALNRFAELTLRCQENKDLIGGMRTALMEEVQGLRESRSVAQGREKQGVVGTDNMQFIIKTVIAIVSMLGGIGITIAFRGGP